MENIKNNQNSQVTNQNITPNSEVKQKSDPIDPMQGLFLCIAQRSTLAGQSSLLEQSILEEDCQECEKLTDQLSLQSNMNDIIDASNDLSHQFQQNPTEDEVQTLTTEVNNNQMKATAIQIGLQSLTAKIAANSQKNQLHSTTESNNIQSYKLAADTCKALNTTIVNTSQQIA